MTAVLDAMRATCDECGYQGTLRALSLHSCAIAEQGGRCEDYPCCGHTDGDGCQTLPEHTSAFYYDNPHLLHEPGSPEWYDALDEDEHEDEAEVCPGGCDEYVDYCRCLSHGETFTDHDEQLPHPALVREGLDPNECGECGEVHPPRAALP